jgi:6-pyruvoyltetrahydropterin/6-carboxytetrahydropterin synthase
VNVQRYATVCKRYRFEAAHQLPHHEGACRRLHGHSYQVEVEVQGKIAPADASPSEGMVIDFGEISQIWRDVIHSRLDHEFLNEVVPENYHPTTAENLACFIRDELAGHGLPIHRVRVWETATGWAEVTL